MIAVAFTGPLAELTSSARAAILQRALPDAEARVADSVRRVIERVRAEGDDALVAFTKDFDRVELRALEVSRSEMARAVGGLDPSIVRALERAKRNLETVHRAFLPARTEVEVEPGVLVGRRPDPLAAVGVYAPGGRAAYPSSVLMGVVPARVAGVRDIVVCSPPGPNGLPSDVVLAAAAIAGATRVFAIGGAQAVAALAFGTATVPKVDRIVGPGNAYVAEAKRQVAGSVGIDAPAGPSEILVIADEGADPEHLAREMLAQAEHDPDASCVALVVGDDLASRVARALAASEPEKREVVAAALGSRGAILSIRSLDEAWPFAAAYAAEHLLLAVRDPASVLDRVLHAGTVFYGDGSSVAFGDYMTGGNHVLPTAGAARSFSGLSTQDFVRWTTYQRVDRAAAATMAGDVALLARAEGLPAHAAAAAAFTEEGARR
ncbi:MAG: histidinol dehydrogenase [Myxococcales bacterium]|nr:histidinol dehydrogenase [Myxococcales bacterium]